MLWYTQCDTHNGPENSFIQNHFFGHQNAIKDTNFLRCFNIQLSSYQPEIQNRFVSPDATYINISVVIIGKMKNFYAKQ